MALTSQQNIPEKPKVSEPWTVKRLFPLAGAVSSITKVFANPFDVLLGFSVLIIGLAELFGRSVSWGFYALVTAILISNLIERRGFFVNEKKIEKNKKTKHGK